ncbi:MAG: DUF3006 domain-containing protein [Firmicutes bacterium HGW-Firmicutes-14]|nr:MAG: DUF3006 domain-containing protein [Firmicutes bacterium HGW-Firmicutes-14]
MFLVIEEIDGPWAIIEWGKDTFRLPKYLLPGSAKQGDRVTIKVLLYSDSDTSRLRREGSSKVVEEIIE